MPDDIFDSSADRSQKVRLIAEEAKRLTQELDELEIRLLCLQVSVRRLAGSVSRPSRRRTEQIH